MFALKTPAELEPREQLCDTFHKASQGAASTQARSSSGGRLVIDAMDETKGKYGQLCGKRTLGTALPASVAAVVRGKAIREERA